MTQKNKTWLKVASIISWIYAGAMIFIGLSIILDLFGMRSVLDVYVTRFVENSSPKHHYDFVKFLVFGEFLFACFINVYAGWICWTLSKKTYIVVGIQRVLVSVGLFQLIFTSNMFSAIVMFVVANTFNKSVWQRKNDEISGIAHEVEKLRILRDTNVISEEEWEERFNLILDTYSKANFNKNNNKDME